MLIDILLKKKFTGNNKFEYDRYEVNHKGENGNLQRFICFAIYAHSNSRTWHGGYHTEWLLVSDGELFVCRDSFGECLVDYHGEYNNEDLPLKRFTEMQICANETDSLLANDLAIFSKKLIHSEFGVDVTNIPVVNVG